MRPCPLAVLAALFVACARPAPPPPNTATNDAFARAEQLARGGDDDAALVAVQQALTDDPGAMQRALLAPAFAGALRDDRAFRRALHDAAVHHRVHEVTLVGPDEPGEWVEVQGRTVDEAGAPLGDVTVFVFATDAEGRYHPTIDGERTPRIFGTIVSDGDGAFRVRTVRPGPYPGTRNPRHLHVMARAGERRLAAPGYVVFDDDPLLFEPANAEPRDEAIRIAMRREADDLIGELVLPLR
jgi:protocatechuate 3,4-dioxygenase beta subunit